MKPNASDAPMQDGTRASPTGPIQQVDEMIGRSMKSKFAKKPIVLLAAAILTVSLAGCEPKKVEETPDEGSNETNDPSAVDERGDGQGLHEEPIVLEDGRTITCVVYDGDNGNGGVSCDWIGPVDR